MVAQSFRLSVSSWSGRPTSESDTITADSMTFLTNAYSASPNIMAWKSVKPFRNPASPNNKASSCGTNSASNVWEQVTNLPSVRLH